ncbi:hypothetical protein SNEBB_002936 [Seison nebaliae]|nr:hypothetical protein SNEBB_002936 [Seison nebaliae]
MELNEEQVCVVFIEMLRKKFEDMNLKYDISRHSYPQCPHFMKDEWVEICEDLRNLQKRNLRKIVHF